MAAPWIRIAAGAVEVQVRVVPRSSRNRIAGVLGDRLKIQVTAPPVEGEANRETVELIARSAGVAVRRGTLVSGAASRSKTVRLETDDPVATAARLETLVSELR